MHLSHKESLALIHEWYQYLSHDVLNPPIDVSLLFDPFLTMSVHF